MTKPPIAHPRKISLGQKNAWSKNYAGAPFLIAVGWDPFVIHTVQFVDLEYSVKITKFTVKLAFSMLKNSKILLWRGAGPPAPPRRLDCSEELRLAQNLGSTPVQHHVYSIVFQFVA